MTCMTLLITDGPVLAFETYDSKADTREMDIEELKSVVGTVALIVHGLDPGPRKTFIVHEAA